MARDTTMAVFRAGAEVAEPPSFTPPEIRPGPPQWDRYYGVRFSTQARVALTVVLCGPAALLTFAALVQFVLGEGPERAAGVILLIPMMAGAPLLAWIYRDLWLPRR